MRIIIATILMLSLAGCSCVYRSDYDAVRNKLSETQTTLNETDAKLKILEQEKYQQSERLKAELEEISGAIQFWADEVSLKISTYNKVTAIIMAQEVVFCSDYQGALVDIKLSINGAYATDGFMVLLKANDKWKLANFILR